MRENTDGTVCDVCYVLHPVCYGSDKSTCRTLARVLEVPFIMADCNSFTQAGYVGDDVEVCVQRLFAASNYDAAKTEHGIICLDEVDKIATAKVSHGRDVSGEGVQQALLKIIEGTTIQVSAKAERGGASRSPGHHSGPGGFGLGTGSLSQAAPKTEVHNISTDNILFIFSGAFVGLDRIIRERISRGSIGFGAPLRSSSSVTMSLGSMTEEAALDARNLPFQTLDPEREKHSQGNYNTLDLLQSTDLQKYGLIPELVGRIPVTTALNALDLDALVRILTETRNSIIEQYTMLHQWSGIEIRFTSSALHALASTAMKKGTGARGLRSVIEDVLKDTMYELPGSSTRFVMINEAVVRKECGPLWFSRGQGHNFRALMEEEQEAWDKKQEHMREKEAAGSFEEYREKAKVSGTG